MTADTANSEMILGTGNKMAAQLQGAGDCYMLARGYSAPIRLQVFDSGRAASEFVQNVDAMLKRGKSFPGFPIVFNSVNESDFSFSLDNNTDYDDLVYQGYLNYRDRGVTNMVAIANGLKVTTDYLQSIIDARVSVNDDFWQ